MPDRDARVRGWLRKVLLVAGVFAAGWFSIAWSGSRVDRRVLAQEKTAVQAAPGATRPLAFEVISIRRNLAPISPQNPVHFGATPDGFQATNLPLIGLFQMAYPPSDAGDSGFFRGASIVGAPDWLNGGEHYDVKAKVAEVDLTEWKTADQTKMLREMLKNLLSERMKVTAHIESREEPVFDLVVAKNGPKFKTAEVTDAAVLKERHPGSMTIPGGTVLTRGREGRMNFFGASMESLTQVLSNLAGRTVVDKTGLKGRYDFSMEIGLPPPPPPGQQLAGPSAGAVDLNTPSIFSVVQDQLGLRLNSAKGQVETLVIDHVERPTEN